MMFLPLTLIKGPIRSTYRRACLLSWEVREEAKPRRAWVKEGGKRSPKSRQASSIKVWAHNKAKASPLLLRAQQRTQGLSRMGMRGQTRSSQGYWSNQHRAWTTDKPLVSQQGIRTWHIKLTNQRTNTRSGTWRTRSQDLRTHLLFICQLEEPIKETE